MFFKFYATKVTCESEKILKKHWLVIKFDRMVGRPCSILFDEHRGIGRYALLATGKPEFFGGGGLDGHILLLYAHDLGKGLLHQGDVGFQFGTFSADGGINVTYTVAFSGDEFDRACQENLAVDILEFPCCVGEVVANVAHVCRPQECIADGMDQYIGIRVAEESAVVFKANTSQP